MKIMRLARNWRDILRDAWSIRFTVLSMMLNAIAAGIIFLEGVLPISQLKFALLVMSVNLAALMSRITFQKGLTDE
jgi:hypothetical protein